METPAQGIVAPSNRMSSFECMDLFRVSPNIARILALLLGALLLVTAQAGASIHYETTLQHVATGDIESPPSVRPAARLGCEHRTGSPCEPLAVPPSRAPLLATDLDRIAYAPGRARTLHGIKTDLEPAPPRAV